MVYSRKPGAHRNKEVMNLDLESFILKDDLLMEAHTFDADDKCKDVKALAWSDFQT